MKAIFVFLAHSLVDQLLFRREAFHLFFGQFLPSEIFKDGFVVETMDMAGKLLILYFTMIFFQGEFSPGMDVFFFIEEHRSIKVKNHRLMFIADVHIHFKALLISLFQLRIADMGIDGCRSYVLMAKEFLDRPDIGAIGHQLRSKGMS